MDAQPLLLHTFLSALARFAKLPAHKFLIKCSESIHIHTFP